MAILKVIINNWLPWEIRLMFGENHWSEKGSIVIFIKK
jgi:hypothetical protein